MRSLRRGHVSKRGSAQTFKRHVRRTKGANVRPAPMRGGYRL